MTTGQIGKGSEDSQYEEKITCFTACGEKISETVPGILKVRFVVHDNR